MNPTEMVVLYFDLREFTARVNKYKETVGEYAPKYLEQVQTTVYKKFTKIKEPKYVKSLGDGALFLFLREANESLRSLVERIALTGKDFVDGMPAFANSFAKEKGQEDVFPNALGISVTYGMCYRFTPSLGKMSTHHDYFGVALNRGARLVDIARPEGVVVERHTTIDFPALKDRGFFPEEIPIKSFRRDQLVWLYIPIRRIPEIYMKRHDFRLEKDQWGKWGNLYLPLEPLLAGDIARSYDNFQVEKPPWDEKSKRFAGWLKLPKEFDEIKRLTEQKTLSPEPPLFNGIMARLKNAPSDAIYHEDEKRQVKLILRPCRYFDFLAVSRSLDCKFDERTSMRKQMRENAEQLGGFLGTSFLYITRDNRLVFVKRRGGLGVAENMRHVAVAEGMRLDQDDLQRSDRDPFDTAVRGMFEEVLEQTAVETERSKRKDWEPFRKDVRILQIFFDWELWQYLVTGYIEGEATYDQVKTNIEAKIGHAGLEHEGVLDGVLWKREGGKENLLDNTRRLLTFVRKEFLRAQKDKGPWSTHALACVLSFLEYHFWMSFGHEGRERLDRLVNELLNLDKKAFYTLGEQKFACS